MKTWACKLFESVLSVAPRRTNVPLPPSWRAKLNIYYYKNLETLIGVFLKNIGLHKIESALWLFTVPYFIEKSKINEPPQELHCMYLSRWIDHLSLDFFSRIRVTDHLEKIFLPVDLKPKHGNCNYILVKIFLGQKTTKRSFSLRAKLSSPHKICLPHMEPSQGSFIAERGTEKREYLYFLSSLI